MRWWAYLYGAPAYIGEGDRGQALTHARKAPEIAPREGETLTTLGETLLGAGKPALPATSRMARLVSKYACQ